MFEHKFYLISLKVHPEICVKFVRSNEVNLVVAPLSD